MNDFNWPTPDATPVAKLYFDYDVIGGWGVLSKGSIFTPEGNQAEWLRILDLIEKGHFEGRGDNGKLAFERVDGGNLRLWSPYEETNPRGGTMIVAEEIPAFIAIARERLNKHVPGTP